MFSIEKVLERDIDLYVINKFLNDQKFKDIFLSKIGFRDYDVINCIHSYFDESGESDITIILKNDEQTIGLLIEDKIAAIAMPNQYDRYLKRGDKLVESNKFNKYFIFIIAPELYLQNNEEAKKYDYKVSYEELYEYVKGDPFGSELLAEAIREKKKGYSVIENKSVTSFWESYYDLVDEKYPALIINRQSGPRGNKSGWPIFLTPIKGVQIYHKSNKGCVDLTFPSVADYYYEVLNIVEKLLKNNMTLVKTGKSLAIREKVPVVDFHSNFSEQYENTIKGLDSVKELMELVRYIDYDQISNLIK